MKKYFPLFIAILTLVSIFSLGLTNESLSFALESGQSAKVIASRCAVYTSADFLSDKITVTAEEEEKTYYLYHDDIVEVLSLENDFALIKSEQDIEGYVYKYYLTQNTPQVVYPVFNGTIRKDTQIFDLDLASSGYTAKKGQRVFIYKAFDTKEDYTSVQVVLDDGSLYNGYVLKKDVNPDGISSLLIVGISVIASAVTIILSIVFIKKRKKK